MQYYYDKTNMGPQLQNAESCISLTGVGGFDMVALTEGAMELEGVTEGVGKGVGLRTPQGPLMSSSQGGRKTPRNHELAPATAMEVKELVPAMCRNRCAWPVVGSTSVVTYST